MEFPKLDFDLETIKEAGEWSNQLSLNMIEQHIETLETDELTNWIGMIMVADCRHFIQGFLLALKMSELREAKRQVKELEDLVHPLVHPHRK